MARQSLKTYSRYKYAKRSYLYQGDRFRASGGPYYLGKDEAGRAVRVPMGERGVFLFRRYCVRGASKWIEACKAGSSGIVIIYVGRPRRSRLTDGVRLAPHTIRPVRDKKAAAPSGVTDVQLLLFPID